MNDQAPFDASTETYGKIAHDRTVQEYRINCPEFTLRSWGDLTDEERRAFHIGVLAATSVAFHRGQMSRNGLARECADLRDQLAQAADELTAAREDAAHQFTQRAVETVRADTAAHVVRAARNLLAGSNGPGTANRRQELVDAVASFDARSAMVAPYLDATERRAALLSASSDALMAAHRELRATGPASVDPPAESGAETGAQGQPEGDAR